MNEVASMTDDRFEHEWAPRQDAADFWSARHCAWCGASDEDDNAGAECIPRLRAEIERLRGGADRGVG